MNRANPSYRSSRALAAGAATLLLGMLAAAPATATTTTWPAGGGQPFDNAQPSLVLNQVVPLAGWYPTRDGGSSSAVGLGSVRTFAGFFRPFDATPADGRLLAIREYAALFSLFGTTYGGDGRTNFALPDLVGNVGVHAGSGPVPLGSEFGERYTTLTTAQMRPHVPRVTPPTVDLLSAGGGQPFGNVQASAGTNYVIALEGSYPVRSGGAVQHTFVGQVAQFGGTFAPGGFAFADGQLLSIAEHEMLFSVIGTTYGGDGVASFALPDLRGRTIVGAGTGNGLSPLAVGQTVGASSSTLTDAQMPGHYHVLPDGRPAISDGLSAPIDNHQPSLALTYLIATTGIYPGRDCCLPVGEETPVLGEITAFAGNYAPAGWTFADGRLLAISQNAALFSLLGTTYGGDGRTTFALPDLRGRAVVGAGEGLPPGTTFGTESIRLTTQTLPSHVHALAVPEPGTYVLMVAGLVVVAGATRRRRSA